MADESFGAALRHALEAVTDGVLVLDGEQRCVYANEPALRGLGVTRGELLGAHVTPEWPLRFTATFLDALARAQDTGEAVHYEDFSRELGRWFECHILPTGGGMVWAFTDITARRRAKDELERHRVRLAEAEAVAHFGSWSWDVRADDLQWSDELFRVMGTTREEFTPSVERYLAMLHPEDRGRVEATLRQAIEERGTFAFRERLIRPDGVVRVIEEQGAVVEDAAGNVARVAGMAHDVTEQDAADDAVRRSEERLRAILEHAPLGVSIKDAAGRYVMVNPEGARLVGRRVEDLVGRTVDDFAPADVAVAMRAADDEVLATGVSSVEEVSGPGADGGIRTYLIVRFRLPGDDEAPTLCTMATDVTERREAQAAAQERAAWAARIDAAVRERRLIAYEQPILDLASGAIASHELLVRLRSDGDGSAVLEPAAFLPAAERHDAVQTIDRWMMGEAIDRARAGRVVEVNLSPRSISDAVTTEALIALLEGAGDAARNVGIEITETAAMRHLEAASAFAQRITALGCRVALDDFGTGYGSFTYLRTLPVHALKIDLAFVRDVVTSEHDQRVVRSIVAIAEQFGLATIAEGVESAEALELLRTMGVDLAQGFHVGRPAPA